jgi:hypothetical protein
VITQAIDKHLIGNERARGDGEDDPLGVLVPRWVITGPNGTRSSISSNKIKAQILKMPVGLGFLLWSGRRGSNPRCQLGKSFKIMASEQGKHRPGHMPVE